MVYVYLNIYDNGCLYIGSHQWSNDGIDFSYKGSSRVAKYYNFNLLRTELLQITSQESRFIDEHCWIEKYCYEYGISDFAINYAKDNSWIDKFPVHGRMLNLHSNDMQNALFKSHSVKCRNKAVVSRQINGYNFTNVIKQAQSFEARSKANTTALYSGRLKSKLDNARKVSIMSRKLNGVKRLNIKCITPQSQEVFGSIKHVVSIIDKPHWREWVRKHLQSQQSCEREGFVFYYVNREYGM